MDDIFLSVEEIERLTGIKRGRGGKSREELQCEYLKENNIPFRPNARGEPIVAKAHYLGSKQPVSKTSWHSNLKAA
jgi:hypothetical protein